MVETVGKRLKAVREERGLSQLALAKLAGYRQQSSISNIENGEQVASTKIARLAAALYVNPHWLETGRGPREPQAPHAPENSYLVSEPNAYYDAWILARLAPDEERLIQAFRKLTSSERETLLQSAEQKAQHNEAVLAELGAIKIA